MARSLVRNISWKGHTLPASILTQQRPDGLYYEVNVPDIPRFRMRWSPLDRYDIVEEDGVEVPYELVLIIADLLPPPRRHEAS